jgi:hypothetical protein
MLHQDNMSKEPINEFKLLAKYNDKFAVLIAFKRFEKELLIFENGKLWEEVLDSTHVHMIYPENGHVHYTAHKDNAHTIKVFDTRTQITFDTKPGDFVTIPNLQILAQRALPFRMFVKPGPQLNGFLPEDAYTLPTSSFIVSEEGLAKFINDELVVRQSDEIIDFSKLDDNIINIHIMLSGSLTSAKKFKFDIPGMLVLKRFDVGDRPVITVSVTAKLNEASA